MFEPLYASDFKDAYKEAKHLIKLHDLGNMEPSLANPFVHEIVESNYKKYFNNDPASVMAIFNDFGQRCDDFKKDHDGLHVLYAGCSYTYAEGVPIELSWSYLVNDYINSNIGKTSGYFNVGKGGANLSTIENQIFGYIKYSGKPDIIFINLPDIGREHLEYRTKMRNINDEKDNVGDVIITIERLNQRLKNLQIICDSLEIKLFIGCWNMNMESFDKIVKDHGNPFLGVDVINLSGDSQQPFGTPNPNSKQAQKLDKEIKELLGPNDPLNNIIYFALDDAHPGLLGHMIMADNFIENLEKWHKSQFA